MDIQAFLSITIIGAFLSVIIDVITSKISNPPITKLITITLAVIVAGLFVWVKNTPYFQTVVLVLGSASIVYGFFLNKKTK